jgi:diacylglycerol kinase family enzyme
MSDNGLCVIYNRWAGQGNAWAYVRRLQRALGRRAAFWRIREPGHGEELARRALRDGFHTVGAAGGDGTLHEVANGILRAGPSDAALVVYPVGSANDYAWSLGLASDWWQRPAGDLTVRALDVGEVRAPGDRSRFFVNCLGLGFNAAVTLERNRIPLLRGLPLYGLSLLSALCLRFARPVMKVTLAENDGSADKLVVRAHPTLGMTVAVGRREGNFILTPDARLDDGLFDYLHAGLLQRWELVRYLPRMITGNLPVHPQLWRGRCRAVTVESETPLAVHLDGELFRRPQDDAHRIDVVMHPRALKVKCPPADGRG